MVVYNIYMVLSEKKIMQILHEHVNLLRKYRVKKIGLFGSYVRGEQKLTSDIDLLVEFDPSAFDENFSGYYDNYLGLLSTLGKILNAKVDLITNDMISPYIKPLMSHEIRYLETA